MAPRVATVICTDYRTAKVALEAHRRFGCRRSIRYAGVDASAIPFADGSIDLVIFKSVLGAMRTWPRQQRMIQEIHRVLRGDGELWFAENLVASPAHTISRRLFVDWGRRWRYVTVAELRELCRPFRRLHIQTRGLLGAFGRSERQRNLLGRVDESCDRLIPTSWKYIAFGVAVK